MEYCFIINTTLLSIIKVLIIVTIVASSPKFHRLVHVLKVILYVAHLMVSGGQPSHGRLCTLFDSKRKKCDASFVSKYHKYHVGLSLWFYYVLSCSRIIYRGVTCNLVGCRSPRLRRDILLLCLAVSPSLSASRNEEAWVPDREI